MFADEADANQAEKSEVKRRPLYVCRAVHNGVWVAGTQKERERRCTVTMHGMVESYEKYELLENVDGAARIAWVYWDRYLQSSVGAVYVDKTLIARREASGSEKSDGEGAPRYTHYIGTLSSYDNFGSITYVNEVRRSRRRRRGEERNGTRKRESERGGGKRGLRNELNRYRSRSDLAFVSSGRGSVSREREFARMSRNRVARAGRDAIASTPP